MTPAQRLRTVAARHEVRLVWGGYASLFLEGLAIQLEQGRAPDAARLLSGRLATVEWMLRDPRLAASHGAKLRAEAEAYELGLDAIDGVEPVPPPSQARAT
jgi:hypothetical protein